MVMRVLAIREDCIVVDTNHPLAGKRVRFDVDIMSVRDATDEEIADAQDEAEDLAADAPCCDHVHQPGEVHDHHHDHGHDHSHDHAHDHGEPLVQLGKKGSA